MTQYNVTLTDIHPETDLRLYLFLKNYTETDACTIHSYCHHQARLTCNKALLHILIFLLMEDIMQYNMSYNQQKEKSRI